MEILGNQPEIIVFYVSLFSLLYIGISVLYYLRIRRQSSFYLRISRGLEIMLLSGVIFTTCILLGATDDFLRRFFVIDWLEESIYSIGYLLYLSLWFHGNNRFLSDTLHTIEERQTSIQTVNKNFYVLIGFLVLLAMVSSLSLFPWYNPSEIFYDFVEALFVIASQLAIVIFAYFARALNKERSETRSLLSKARLELGIYAIVVQIIISLCILVGATYLVFISASQESDVIAETILFIGINILMMITTFILVSSLSIPEWVRKRNKIGSDRFKTIQKLQNSDDI